MAVNVLDGEVPSLRDSLNAQAAPHLLLEPPEPLSVALSSLEIDSRKLPEPSEKSLQSPAFEEQPSAVLDGRYHADAHRDLWLGEPKGQPFHHALLAGHTDRLDRTCRAIGPGRLAHQGPEFHHGLVEDSRMPFGQEVVGNLLEPPLRRRVIRGLFDSSRPAQDTCNIPIEHGHVLVKSDAGNGGGRVGSDAGELLQGLRFARDSPFELRP